MNGMIFVELMDHLESALGIEAVDRLITTAGVSGAYTAVEEYDDAELVALVTAVADELQTPIPDLLEQTGRALFVRLLSRYPHFAEGVSDPREFLTRVGERIHRHVVMLYPASAPPTITTVREDDGTMTLTYESRRAMWPLALGLIRGCGEHFGEELEIETEQLAEDGTHTRFSIR